jgi:hypothetical protein
MAISPDAQKLIGWPPAIIGRALFGLPYRWLISKNPKGMQKRRVET